MQRVKLGKEIYGKRCWGCHGIKGNGRGPVKHLLNFEPRDFTRGFFKNKGTTHTNAFPYDEDLIKKVSKGHPSSNMPGFGDVLKEEEIKLVVGYIETFSSSSVGSRP